MRVREKDTRTAVPPKEPRPDPPGKPKCDTSYPTVREQLIIQRDKLLSTLRTYLSVKILIRDVDGFKDFIKYINRYTASEVQWLIEREGYAKDIEKIIDKIEKEHYPSSPTTKTEEVEVIEG